MTTENPVGRIILNDTVIPLATSPYIGTNGHWWIWDTAQQTYVDSGYDATTPGRQGAQGVGLKNTAPVVSATTGKLSFTLADPSQDGLESTIETTNSVQGVGISDVAEIIDSSSANYRKLQITTKDPKNTDEATRYEIFTTNNTVVPLASWTQDQLSIEVGGNTVQSPHLQGVGIKTTGTSTITENGKLSLTLQNPLDSSTSTLISDKSIQGIGIGAITVNNEGQLVIPFVDPKTGTAPESPATLVTPQVVPTCQWDNVNHTLTINVGGQAYTSANLQGETGNQGEQGYQGIYVSSGEVSVNGQLTFHLTDPSGTTTPSDIVVSGYFTGPQGKNITDIQVTNDYKLQFTLYDPATETSSTLVTTDSIQPTTVNNVEPVGNNVTITGENIPVDTTAGSMTVAQKFANVASVSVKDTVPSEAAPAPTATEKLGLWVVRSTGEPFVYDSTNDVWIKLGANWK